MLQGADPDHLKPSSSAVLSGKEAQVLDLSFYAPVTFAVEAVIGDLESRASDPASAKPGTTPPPRSPPGAWETLRSPSPGRLPPTPTSSVIDSTG